MSEVYAARSVARKHIVEQCENCNVKKNSNGLYHHDDVVKAQETMEGLLKEVFLDHESGLTMVSLLEVADNAINTVTTNQMVTADALIAKSKKEVAEATAAATKVAKQLGTTVVDISMTVMTREEAKRDADRQNITNQTIIGTKVGIVDVLKRIIGGDILDMVTKVADGSREKSIDDYKLHELFQLALDNSVRPEVDDVLENLLEVYQYDFDFRMPVKHGLSQLRMMANKLKPFGITPGEPELTLIILANIHHAKEQDWGHEFRAAMSAIRKKYNYDYIHDATSLAVIIKELSDADELRNMKLAPAPTVNKANAVSKHRATLEGALSNWSTSSFADSSTSSFGYGSDVSDSTQEECLRVAERHQYKKEKKEKDKKHYKSRSSTKSSEASSDIDTSSDDETVVPATCKYCKHYKKSQHPSHITPDTCMWNKKVKKFRYNSVCRKMRLKYISSSEFEKDKEAEWPKHKAWEGKKKDD